MTRAEALIKIQELKEAGTGSFAACAAIIDQIEYTPDELHEQAIEFDQGVDMCRWYIGEAHRKFDEDLMGEMFIPMPGGGR